MKKKKQMKEFNCDYADLTDDATELEIFKSITKQSKKKESKQNKAKKWKFDTRLENVVEEKMEEGMFTLKEETTLKQSKQKEKSSNGTKGLPPLYICAQKLKERVCLVNYQDALYYYNGKCYDFLSAENTIRLYRKEVDKELSGEKSMNTILQLHKFLVTDTDIRVKKSDKNMRIAILKNGIFDVEEQRLYPHSSEKIAFSYIDANYVEGKKCKKFDKFLNQVVQGDEILLKRLWLSLGYILMQTVEGKCFFVMGEASDSGKSLFGNFIESLFPEKYVSNIALNDFNKEFSLSSLVGSALNVSLDLPSSRLNSNAVSKLKMLTGGDAININQKYVSEFRYENRAKFIFASNYPISIAENDNAFWKRLVYLPFEYSIPKDKQNPKLFLKFQEEKDAIVSKALWYAKELIDLNFEFPSTPKIIQKMQEWQGVNDISVETFVQKCCCIGREQKGELVENLYSAYKSYCRILGYPAKKRSEFKQFLENQMKLEHFKMRKGGENPQSAFRGIALRGGVEYGE